jgi:hypothetical protein
LGPHRSARIGSSLIGAVGVGAFLTGFLTLDCRQIDTGCENASGQATAHVVGAAPTLLLLLVEPFVLARALRLAPRWPDLRARMLALGFGTIAGLIGGSLVGNGLGQYLMFVPWFAWIALLAVRMLQLAREAEPVSDISPGVNVITPPGARDSRRAIVGSDK